MKITANSQKSAKSLYYTYFTQSLQRQFLEKNWGASKKRTMRRISDFLLIENVETGNKL